MLLPPELEFELELERDVTAALEPVPVANDVQLGKVDDACLFSISTSRKLRLRCRIAAGYSKLGSCSNRVRSLAEVVVFMGKKAGVSGLHDSVRSGRIPVSKYDAILSSTHFDGCAAAQ